MIGRRKKNLELGMDRLYVYRGKRTTTYYTITPANQRINLGHDLREAKKRLLEFDGDLAIPGTLADHIDDLIKDRGKRVASGKLSAATLESNLLEAAQLKKTFGKMAPEDLRPTHVWAYLHKFRGKESTIRPAVISRPYRNTDRPAPAHGLPSGAQMSRACATPGSVRRTGPEYCAATTGHAWAGCTR